MTTNHHHDTVEAMEKRRGGTRPKEAKQVAMVVRLDQDQRDAFTRWAIAEERSVAAHVRVVLAAAIPEQYYQFPKP